MQENEFEKKLQLKLDELRVQPADEVWLKIQSAVNTKQRRKRRVLFFLLIAAFFTAGLLIKERSLFTADSTAFADTKTNQLTTAATADQRNSISGASSVKQDKENSIAATNKQGSGNSAITNNTDNTATGLAPIIVASQQQKGKLKLLATAAGAGQDYLPVSASRYASNKIKSKKAASVKTIIVAAEPGEDANADVQDVATTVAEKTITVADTDVAVASPHDSVINKNTVVIKEEVKPADQQNKTAKKNNDKKAWDIRWSVAAGVYATGNSYASNKALAQADYTAANPGNVGNAGNLFLPPSTVMPGYGIKLGLAVYRQLSSRVKLSAGIGYQLLTTRIKTGVLTDSAIATRQTLFANGSQRVYNNYYHLVSVPLRLSTTMFTIAGSDVTLDIGVDFSRLISTNALQYNLGRSIYYKDNSLFNKNVVGLSAGVNIHLFPKQKNDWYIGPEFYYGITPIATAGMYSGAHPSYWGIRLQKSLKK